LTTICKKICWKKPERDALWQTASERDRRAVCATFHEPQQLRNITG